MENGITAAKLCEIYNRDKAEVFRTVKVLEEKGFVVRTNTTLNGYRANITLTEKGRGITCALRERIKLAVEKGGARLSVEERKIFYNALATISQNLKNISEDGLK